jgi:hypothetical protein
LPHVEGLVEDYCPIHRKVAICADYERETLPDKVLKPRQFFFQGLANCDFGDNRLLRESSSKGLELANNMQSLQRQASLMSGVSQEDSTAVYDVNLYERLGYDTFVKLSTNFYNK